MTDYRAIYQAAFSTPGYAHVTDEEFRYAYASQAISALGTQAASLLDVGTGRGDFLRIVRGTFPSLHLVGVDVARFHQLPVSHLDVDLCTDGGRTVIRQLRFDVISCLDVLEHLPESDLPAVVSSLASACQSAVVTVANHSDLLHGVELHQTQRPAEWWRDLLGEYFDITDEAEHYAGTLYAFRLRSKKAIRCSIVVATYNKARLLDLSLRSIAQQSPPFEYEVIVVDDGSADETRDVCLKHGVRYAYLDRPYYCNPSKARNLGLRMARGEIIIQQCEVIHHSADSIQKLVSRLEPGHMDFATLWNATEDPGGIGSPEGASVVNLVPGMCYSGSENPRPFFFLGVAYRADLFAVGGHDEEFLYPGYDDTWLAECLIRTRGLVPRFWDDVLAYHLHHERPPWVYGAHAEMMHLFEHKMKKGQFVATGGPWR